MKPGRNDPCPCGSSRKWKKCCALAAPATTPATPAVVASTEEVPPSLPPPRGGSDWVPLQHQARALRPGNFGRKKPF